MPNRCLSRTQRTYLFAILVLSLSGALAVVAAAALAAPTQPAAQQQGKGLQEALKGAVAAAQVKLGVLEPWQKKVFDEEVIPQYQRFIRDYRAAGQGYAIEVDVEALRKYLAFNAVAKGAKGSDFRVAVYLRSEPECARCTSSMGAVRELVSQRLERRGFAPVWLSLDEVGDPTAIGRELEERVLEHATRRHIPASAVVQWRQAPVDAIDTAHADERRYQIRASLIAREPVEGSNRQLRHDGSLEILDSDTVESAVSRLLMDTLTDLGSQTLLAQIRATEGANDEIQLVVSGVGDFAQFTKLKAQLLSQLPDASSIEERQISRGQVTFAIRSAKPPRTIRRSLAGMPVDAAKLAVREAGPAIAPGSLPPGSSPLPADPERLIEAEIRGGAPQ